MPCQIQDFLYAYTNTLTPDPQVNQQLYAVPSSDALRISVMSQYRILAVNPNITTPAFNKGLTATTDSNGQFSFTLPYASSETKPTVPLAKWSLVFPDGRIFTGEVPAIAGPVTLDQLATTYGWVWSTSVTQTSPITGASARGTASFVSATSFNVVFLNALANASYQIDLSASEDQVVSGTAPSVWWSNKTTSGFTINTSATFTGFVDWTAAL